MRIIDGSDSPSVTPTEYKPRGENTLIQIFDDTGKCVYRLSGDYEGIEIDSGDNCNRITFNDKDGDTHFIDTIFDYLVIGTEE